MPTVAEIQSLVAAEFGVTVFDMRSQRQGEGVAQARHVAMYLARQTTPLSLPAIGREFGRRDHTTVLYGVRRIEQLAATADPDLGERVVRLRAALEP